MPSIWKLLTAGRGRQMDALQVSMTGVRMGERFLQIGCDDRALLSGLAAKVGLSGTAAVASMSDEAAARAAGVGTKVGALIDIRPITADNLPFDSDGFDMVVVDDTRGTFGRLTAPTRTSILRDACRVVRPGGRIEVVEGVGTRGLMGSDVRRSADYNVVEDLESAGFKPVRALAERDGYRFVEGLRPA